MDILDKVKVIIAKGFTEYTIADIDELSKLKLGLWELVSGKEWEYLIAKQLYKKEKTILYMQYKEEKKFWTDSQTKEASYLETVALEEDTLTKELAYKLVRQFHYDLQDVLIAVRLAAKTYDDDIKNQWA